MTYSQAIRIIIASLMALQALDAATINGYSSDNTIYNYPGSNNVYPLEGQQFNDTAELIEMRRHAFGQQPENFIMTNYKLDRPDNQEFNRSAVLRQHVNHIINGCSDYRCIRLNCILLTSLPQQFKEEKCLNVSVTAMLVKLDARLEMSRVWRNQSKICNSTIEDRYNNNNNNSNGSDDNSRCQEDLANCKIVNKRVVDSWSKLSNECRSRNILTSTTTQEPINTNSQQCCSQLSDEKFNNEKVKKSYDSYRNRSQALIDQYKNDLKQCNEDKDTIDKDYTKCAEEQSQKAMEYYENTFNTAMDIQKDLLPDAQNQIQLDEIIANVTSVDWISDKTPSTVWTWTRDYVPLGHVLYSILALVIVIFIKCCYKRKSRNGNINSNNREPADPPTINSGKSRRGKSSATYSSMKYTSTQMEPLAPKASIVNERSNNNNTPFNIDKPTSSSQHTSVIIN